MIEKIHFCVMIMGADFGGGSLADVGCKVENISLFDDEFLGGDFPRPVVHKPKKNATARNTVTDFAGSWEADSLWQLCLETLRLEMSEIEFNQWLKPLKPQIIDDHLVLFAINVAFIRHINTNYLHSINHVLAQHGARHLSAKVQVQARALAPKHNKTSPKKRALSATMGARIDESDDIDVRCTFENFVKSKSNRLVYDACYELGEKAGQTTTGNHLLFIYGSSGLGKTHLMQAVAHRYQKAGLSYCYFTKDHFFQTVIQAMRDRDGVGNLVKRIGKADLLMIDDVHMINERNGPRVSQFLMTLFESFVKNNKQLILASNRPPSQMQDFDTHFLSRFSGGLSLPIEPPEIETRVQILQKKADALHIQLPKECALFIAQNAPPDVRSLEGALNQVMANALLSDGLIDLALVRRAIKDHVEARARAINAENIRDVVAGYYGVSTKDLLGKKRLRSIVRPRQMAMALIRELTHDSFPEIGQVFGGRDHTTVIHACETIARLRLSDPKVEKDYHDLMATLRLS